MTSRFLTSLRHGRVALAVLAAALPLSCLSPAPAAASTRTLTRAAFAADQALNPNAKTWRVYCHTGATPTCVFHWAIRHGGADHYQTYAVTYHAPASSGDVSITEIDFDSIGPERVASVLVTP